MDTAFGDPVVTLNNGIELIYKRNVDIIFGPTNASGSRYFENIIYNCYILVHIFKRRS